MNLDILHDTLGYEKSRRFLRITQPEIIQRSELILSNLKQQNWDEAAAHAHRFKGTIRLYSTKEIEEKIQKIIDLDKETIATEAFINNLKTALESLNKNISNYLSEPPLID